MWVWLRYSFPTLDCVWCYTDTFLLYLIYSVYCHGNDDILRHDCIPHNRRDNSNATNVRLLTEVGRKNTQSNI